MKMHPAAIALLLGTSITACGGSTPPAGSPSAESLAPSAPGPATAPEPSAGPPSAELMAGIKAFDAGSFPEARRSFEAATRKNKNDFDAFYNLGMACEKLGDVPAAVAAYKAALSINPGLETAAAELCALDLDQGQVDDSLSVGRAGLAKHPASGPLHENVGLALATRGEEDGAVRELREAIKSQASDPMYRLALAHWLNMWHVPGAVPELDAARELVKDDYGLIVSIGHEYRMAGDFPACVKTFDGAIASKDGGEVRTERALCKLGLKDEKATFDDLRAAVAAEPSYATAHYYLGGRLALAKRYKEAAAEYGKYLELAPTGSLAKPAKERRQSAESAAATSKK